MSIRPQCYQVLIPRHCIVDKVQLAENMLETIMKANLDGLDLEEYMTDLTGALLEMRKQALIDYIINNPKFIQEIGHLTTEKVKKQVWFYSIAFFSGCDGGIIIYAKSREKDYRINVSFLGMMEVFSDLKVTISKP